MPTSPRPRATRVFRWVGAVVPLVVVSLSQSAAAGWREGISYIASERLRFESVDWFAPAADSVPAGAARYVFGASRLRAGVRATFPAAQVVVELQDTRLFGLPDDASRAAPYGNLGPGALYFAHDRETHPGETVLKQAFATLRHGGLAATLGRFEHGDGAETAPGDPTLLWLERTRIAERLIGPFGYTHVGRAFDGVRLGFDHPRWNATAVAVRPTQGGFTVSANPEIQDIALGALALSLKEFGTRPIAEARVFAALYDDRRNQPVHVDNRPAAVRAADHQPIEIGTVGGDLVMAAALPHVGLDGLLWGCFQVGDWGAQEHRAWAYSAEGGVQAPDLYGAPWIRGGTTLGSGDGEPNDGRHRTFFQVLPTPRIYAQLPFYNLMNLEDVFVQIILRPESRLSLRGDLHWLRLDQPRDLWYAGGGATRTDVFGFAGIRSGGRRHLARVAEVSVTATIVPRFSVYGYLGHASGGDVVRATFERDDADYGYLEVTLRY